MQEENATYISNSRHDNISNMKSWKAKWRGDINCMDMWLQLLSMHDRWEVCKGEHFNDDDLIFTIKKTSMVQFKTHLHVFLRGNDNDDAPDFEVKGNFFEREAHILHGEQAIAEVFVINLHVSSL